MTAAFILGQNVNLTVELGVGVYRTGLAENLTSFDVRTLYTTEKCTDVVACLSVIEDLSEHLDTGNNSLCSFLGETDDLNFVGSSELTSFNSTCSNSTTTSDSEYVLNRHKEGEICLSVGSRDILINSIHELLDASILGSIGILGIAHESLVCRTLDDRSIIARELIAVEGLTDIHLNELEKLSVIDLVNLVHENNDVGNANLTGKEKMLLGLSHRTIGRSNNKDSTIHLCSTGDHVLNIVSMARAVNVSIVTLVSLILNVSSVDGDTSFSLLGSLIDVSIVLELCLTLEGKILGDSSGKSSLAVVNVTDGTNVYMGLGSFKLLLCHWKIPP